VSKKLNLHKVIEFKPTYWRKVAVFIRKWIKADMLLGKCQEYFGMGYQYTKQYAKYKANNMRRFTTGAGKVFTNKSGDFFGTTYFQNKKAGVSKKKGYGTGKRLKAYEGKPIKSTHVSSVNMFVTGETIDGLAYTSSTPTNMRMEYKQKDADKVLGNEEHGRSIRTLNEKNMVKLKNEFEKQINKQVKNWAKKPIYLSVGK